MYDELVKALRNMSKMGVKYGMAAVKMQEAADTIEELSVLCASQSKDCSEAIAKYIDLWERQPHWIPVTERLPEEPYGCLAIVWDDNPFTGETFLNYYPEYIGFDGDQWNDADGEEIPLDVVYWMKMPQIPEPPNQEEEP